MDASQKVQGEGKRGTLDASSGFRVCLTISGLRCASEGAPLERALKRLDGVRDATVNPLRDRISIEVDRLPRLEVVVRMLASRGYSIGTGEVQVTTWIDASRTRLGALRRELLERVGVGYCRVGSPTGRVDLGISIRPRWEITLREVCTRLREAAAEEYERASRTDAQGE